MDQALKRSKPKSDSIFVSLKILIFDKFYRSIKDEDFQTDKDKLVEAEADGWLHKEHQRQFQKLVGGPLGL